MNINFADIALTRFLRLRRLMSDPVVTVTPPVERKLLVEALATEDGDAWGVYAYGHIDPALLTLDLINKTLDDAGLDPLDRAEPVHLWMYAEEDEDGEMPDYCWHFCPAGTEGAIAVTGIDLQA